MGESQLHRITDEGRRLSEAHDEARRRGGVGRWVAVALDSGKWDQEIYDTREDAGRHTDESRTAYVQVQPAQMPPPEATAWIDLTRKINGAGFRLTDPDAPRQQPGLGSPDWTRSDLTLPGEPTIIIPNRQEIRRLRRERRG